MKTRVWTVMKVGLLVMLIAPIAVVVYASEDCCFGTSCPNVSGCHKWLSSFYNQTCKRTCTSSTPHAPTGMAAVILSTRTVCITHNPGRPVRSLPENRLSTYGITPASTVGTAATRCPAWM
jgi:hypothetical protein